MKDCQYSLTSRNNLRIKPPPCIGERGPRAKAIHVCREYAIHKFEEAQEIENFMCGMQPFDADEPMHGVICTRNGLECHQPMDFEYYQDKVVAA